MEHLAVRTHDKMKDVLMDPDAAGPDVHYYMIRGGSDQRNITVWEPGVVGSEYIKTYGHYHVDDLPETYWFIFGDGVVLLQKLAVDVDGKSIPDIVEEFRAIQVKAGDTLHIPVGWGHLAVNTGKSYLVSADDSPVNFGDKDPIGMPSHADYSLVKKMRGFAFYVIDNNGTAALVRNSAYKAIKKSDLGNLPVIDR